jgi:hypothetical protein
MVNILMNYPHIIALAVFGGVAFVSLLRYFSVSIFARVSWKWLFVFVVVFYLSYGALLSWGQHFRWEGSALTRDLLVQPLSKDVPLPSLLEWTRPILEKEGGYFKFYAFGHFFLSSIFLFLVTGLFVLVLKLRARYRPINFAENDISAIAIAVLVSGWPGVIVLIPLGFLCAIIISLVSRVLYGTERVYLPPAFLIASPIALAFTVPILKYIHLYTLLKL